MDTDWRTTQLLQGQPMATGEIMSYEIGDLIYAPKWGEYAVYLGKGTWIGWIHIFRLETGSKDQVHDYVWELA